MKPGHDSNSEKGAVGFTTLRHVSPCSDGLLSDGVEFFGVAYTLALVVVGAVLVIEGAGTDSRESVRY